MWNGRAFFGFLGFLFWSHLGLAAPIAGDVPIKFGHLETSAQATVGGDRLNMLALGRIGLGNEVDSGLHLSYSTQRGHRCRCATPFFWVKANQLNNLVVTSDGWVAMQDPDKPSVLFSRKRSITTEMSCFQAKCW